MTSISLLKKGMTNFFTLKLLLIIEETKTRHIKQTRKEIYINIFYVPNGKEVMYRYIVLRMVRMARGQCLYNFQEVQ